MTRTGAAIVALWLAGTALLAQGGGAELSELERTRLELLRVRTAYAQVLTQFDACKSEQATLYDALGKAHAAQASEALTAQEASLKADVEAAHPGYTFNPKTGTLTPVKKGS